MIIKVNGQQVNITFVFIKSTLFISRSPNRLTPRWSNRSNWGVMWLLLSCTLAGEAGGAAGEIGVEAGAGAAPCPPGSPPWHLLDTGALPGISGRPCLLIPVLLLLLVGDPPVDTTHTNLTPTVSAISTLAPGEERRNSHRPSGPSPAGSEAEKRFLGDKV